VNEHEALDRAVAAARKSPCAKSQRGVIVWNRPGLPPPRTRWSFFLGWNHPPRGLSCDGSQWCKQWCSKLCVHAEADAIASAMRGCHSLEGWDMLHVKIVGGVAAPSGPPSCWQCSRTIVDAGIGRMWLLHESGLRSYSADEFHELTLQTCGLPVIRSGAQEM